MDKEQFRLEVEKARKKMIKHQNKLLTLQNECCYHANTTYRNAANNPNLTVEYKSSTGNWCRDDDSYWVECKCNICDFRFTVDSI